MFLLGARPQLLPLQLGPAWPHHSASPLSRCGVWIEVCMGQRAHKHRGAAARFVGHRYHRTLTFTPWGEDDPRPRDTTGHNALLMILIVIRQSHSSHVEQLTESLPCLACIPAKAVSLCTVTLARHGGSAETMRRVRTWCMGSLVDRCRLGGMSANLTCGKARTQHVVLHGWQNGTAPQLGDHAGRENS